MSAVLSERVRIIKVFFLKENMRNLSDIENCPTVLIFAGL